MSLIYGHGVRVRARPAPTHSLAEKATVCGFRSTFRNWCSETRKLREVAEVAIAHVVSGVEGAYFRLDLFERRRRLMDAWAAFVAQHD